MSGMTTLERLENVEKKVNEFESGIQTLVNLSEKISNTAFKSDRLESDMQMLGNALRQQADMIMTLVHQDRDLQESIGNLAKTVAALAEVLEAKEVISPQEFQKKRQQNEDKEQRRIVDSLLKMGSIEAQNDPINGDSLVVLSRSEIVASDPTQSHLLSECLLIDMSSPVISSELRQDLLGKSAGESVSYVKDSDSGLYSILNIKEVYSHKTVQINNESVEGELKNG